MKIIASNCRPSKCTDVAGAVDVDVRVVFADGVVDASTVLDGEVTLAPSQYDGSLEAFGDSADMWVSGALLAALEARFSEQGDLARAFAALEYEAADVASAERHRHRNKRAARAAAS